MGRISKAVREAVGNKSRVIPGYNPDVWRLDAAGNRIRKASYGTQGKYGWEVDHIIPKALGGPDHPANYQALPPRRQQSEGQEAVLSRILLKDKRVVDRDS